MRIPSNIYTNLEKAACLDRKIIKNYIHGYSTPSKKRAILLEKASIKAGVKISKELWIFGSPEERKQILLNAALN